MSSRLIVAVAAALLASGPAWAEDAPPRGERTPDETRRVLEALPPSIEAQPPRGDVLAYPQPAGSRPVGPAYGSGCCWQPRDACGWPVDRCGERYGRWSVGLEGGAMFLTSPDGVLGEPLFTTDPGLDWNDVDYDPTIAARLTIGVRPCDSPATLIEARGTWWGSPDGDATQRGFFAATPGSTGTGDVSREVRADFSSEADLWDVELNYWHEIACTGRWRFDAGLGARWIQFNEDARVDFTTLGPGGFPVDDGFARAEVENRFLGGQLLLGAHYDAAREVELYGRLKFLFGSLRRDIDVTDLDVFAGGAHSASSKDDELVFGTDAELGVKWRLTRCLAVTAAYQLLFLDNVQRAEDALDFSASNSGAVQAKQAPDQLFVQGFWLGVTLNF